jgi:hypothetical protein
MFIFKNKYPQEFLDRLADALGIKWTKVKPQLVDRDSFEVKPLPPPSGVLFYMDPLFTDKRPSQKEDEK